MAAQDSVTGRRQQVAARAEQLRGLIRQRYPEAQFRLVPGEERDTYNLLAYTKDDDATGVIELTSELVTDILVDEPFAIYVIPLPLSDYRNGRTQKRVA